MIRPASPKPKPPTRKALLAALDEIAQAIIPSFPMPGRGDMVDLHTVIYLREVAREVLRMPKNEED